MKKVKREIKEYVNKRFNPQGITIDIDYMGNGIYSLSPSEGQRLNFDWGRTLIDLRKEFQSIPFSNGTDKVNNDNFESEIIYFNL
jgi:hypothetical protein